jgi:hypothetical protein
LAVDATRTLLDIRVEQRFIQPWSFGAIGAVGAQCSTRLFLAGSFDDLGEPPGLVGAGLHVVPVNAGVTGGVIFRPVLLDAPGVGALESALIPAGL